MLKLKNMTSLSQLINLSAINISCVLGIQIT